jgi:hypothetical protein
MGGYEEFVHKPPHEMEKILSAIADKRNAVYAEKDEIKEV